MVLQSEMAFRMLVRRHSCTLCYTPMLPAKAFISLPLNGPAIADTGGPATQSAYFTTCKADRPLLAQLGGSEPAEMLAAALLIQDRVDGIDVNFGCPQACAATGNYGAFLLDQPDKARAIVETLVAGLKVPVTAKIRIFPELADTIAFAKMLEDAGCAAVAVHGRRREQRHHEGPADWGAIGAVKSALRIPVIANGNIRVKADADRCIRETGVDCVMSAKALLINPRLFGESPTDRADIGRGVVGGDGDGGGCDGAVSAGGAKAGGESTTSDPAQSASSEPTGRPPRTARAEMALEYLECCKQWPDGALPRMMSDHLAELLEPDLGERFNAEEKKEVKAHRTTTRPAQFASLVRRIQAHGAFYEESARQRTAKRTPPAVPVS